MEHLVEILSEPVTAIVIICAFLLAIKELYELFRWWKDRADGYHRRASEKEDLNQKVCDIACTSDKHTEALEQIGTALDGINDRLSDMEDERKEDIVATGRATLYHLAEKLMDKDSLTMAEYETFSTIAHRYEAAGGNSVFRDKIIPAILNKPIDEDGA